MGRFFIVIDFDYISAKPTCKNIYQLIREVQFRISLDEGREATAAEAIAKLQRDFAQLFLQPGIVYPEPYFADSPNEARDDTGLMH